jgi:hypothetical protein
VQTASMVMTTGPEAPSSIPGATKFLSNSGSIRGPFNFLRITEETYEWKLASPFYKTKINGRGQPLR